jgi:hypothetical protein
VQLLAGSFHTSQRVLSSIRLLCKRFVSRDTGRQMPRVLFMHSTFDARQHDVHVMIPDDGPMRTETCRKDNIV